MVWNTCGTEQVRNGDKSICRKETRPEFSETQEKQL